MSFPFDFSVEEAAELPAHALAIAFGGGGGQIRTRDERDADTDADADGEEEDSEALAVAMSGFSGDISIRRRKVRAPVKRMKPTERSELEASQLISAAVLRPSEQLHLQYFNENIFKLLSDSLDDQIAAACFFRNVLSAEKHDPIASVLTSGVAKRLIDLMKFTDSLKLLEEILWALTNLACGQKHQTRIFFDEGVVPLLIGMISSGTLAISDQAMVSTYVI
jgi:hypothetical protein